jgi:hypothetical protein
VILFIAFISHSARNGGMLIYLKFFNEEKLFNVYWYLLVGGKIYFASRGYPASFQA